MGESVLYLGNQRYSSWSLRPWLVARKAGVPFVTRVVSLRDPAHEPFFQQVSPSGRVPLWVTERGLNIWDSLAIAEWLAEQCPRLWPADPEARAVARAVSAEMHSGFVALRTQCPMNLGRLGQCLQVTPQPDTARDLDRIATIWRDCRERFGQSGPWLFGDFCIADAMFAPVVLRWVIYGLPRSAAVEDYVQHWLADIDLQDWIAAAQAETETIDRFEQE